MQPVTVGERSRSREWPVPKLSGLVQYSDTPLERSPSPMNLESRGGIKGANSAIRIGGVKLSDQRTGRYQHLFVLHSAFFNAISPPSKDEHAGTNACEDVNGGRCRRTVFAGKLHYAISPPSKDEHAGTNVREDVNGGRCRRTVFAGKLHYAISPPSKDERSGTKASQQK